jgi:hypothetical protein
MEIKGQEVYQGWGAQNLKNDNFNRVVLCGILLCLTIIAYKISFNQKENIQMLTPNVSVSSQNENIVQIAPNRIGVVDTGSNSGWHQLVVFEYHSDTKKFVEVSSLPYEDIFNNPNQYGIPTRDQKYGK